MSPQVSNVLNRTCKRDDNIFRMSKTTTSKTNIRIVKIVKSKTITCTPRINAKNKAVKNKFFVEGFSTAFERKRRKNNRKKMPKRFPQPPQAGMPKYSKQNTKNTVQISAISSSDNFLAKTKKGMPMIVATTPATIFNAVYSSNSFSVKLTKR